VSTISILNHRKKSPSVTCTCCGIQDESFHQSLHSRLWVLL
jgi:hypothetical protein